MSWAVYGVVIKSKQQRNYSGTDKKALKRKVTDEVTGKQD